MAKGNSFLRFASPYEGRLAIRDTLGFHNGSAIGAVYEIRDEGFDTRLSLCFSSALRKCVEKQPFLTAVMKDTITEKPFWESVSTVNLEDHISIISDDFVGNGTNENKVIEKVLPSILDGGFTDSLPPWRIVVLPLTAQRCFICFVFSHCIGDGGAGLAFHLEFLNALRHDAQEQRKSFLTMTVRNQKLPDAFDTAENLPVSDKFLKSLASSSLVDANTWTGVPVHFESKEGLRTRLRLIELEAPTVQAALRASRAHNTKLTATLHLLIVRALSRVVQSPEIRNFASITAIDLRRAAGVPPTEWGIFVSGVSTKHERVDASSPISDEEWAAASAISDKLATTTATLEDQMTGLLRFAPNQKNSMLSKLGGRRDCSYAMSNMGTFDAGDEKQKYRISKMINLTSALVPGPPLSFSVYSIKHGSLICSVSWQPGALGVSNEDSFVDGICSTIQREAHLLELE